jgi:hypothetical protein
VAIAAIAIRLPDLDHDVAERPAGAVEDPSREADPLPRVGRTGHHRQARVPEHPDREERAGRLRRDAPRPIHRSDRRVGRGGRRAVEHDVEPEPERPRLLRAEWS